MNRIHVFFAIALVLCLGALAPAQEIYLDTFEQVADLTVFQSLGDESEWYYLADQIRLAQRDGKPQFSFLKFVTNEDTGSEGGITAAQGGGVIHMLVEFHVSDSQKRRAEQELQRRHPGSRIAGPIIYRNGTFTLISATLDEDGQYADKIVGVGRAPVMEGHKAAVSILLSKQGATLLWESFKTDTPDISVNFEMEIAGYREPFDAKVKGDWNLISKHSNLALGLRASMIGIDVQRTVSELRQSNAIEVEVKGSDEMGDAMVTQIEGKLVDFIFERINDPEVLQSMVEDGDLYSNADRASAVYERNQQRREQNESSEDDSSSHNFLFYKRADGPLLAANSPMNNLILEYASVRKSLGAEAGGQVFIPIRPDLIDEGARRLRGELRFIFIEVSTYEAARKQQVKQIITTRIRNAVNRNYQLSSNMQSRIEYIFRNYEDDGLKITKLVEAYIGEARAYARTVEHDPAREPVALIGQAEEEAVSDSESSEEGSPSSTDEGESAQRETPDSTSTQGTETRGTDQRRPGSTQSDTGTRSTIDPNDSCLTAFRQRDQAAFRNQASSIINSSTTESNKIRRLTGIMQSLINRHTSGRADSSGIRSNLQRLFSEECTGGGQDRQLRRLMTLMSQYIDALCDGDPEPVLNCDEEPAESVGAARTRSPQSSGSGEAGGEDAPAEAAAEGQESASTSDEPENAADVGGDAESEPEAAGSSGNEEPAAAEEEGAEEAEAENEQRQRPSARSRERNRGSSFALMAAYRVKRFKTSGTFSFSFNKKMLSNQVVTMAHNVGDLYNRYGKDPAIFREVNLDDPVYKQREIIVFLDGQDKEAFDKYINYVTVSLRKKHQNGQVTVDEVRIDRNNFNNEGNIFRMMYGWKGDDDRERWLEYEYRTTWSYHGGFTHQTDWKTTSDFNITVSPPHRYRTIQLEADPETLRDEGVRLTTVTFYYDVLGRDMPPIQVSMRTNDEELAQVLEYMHTAGVYDYEYELKWRVHGQYLSTGRLKGNEDFIFIDELPR